MRLGYFAMPLHPPGSDPAQTMGDDLEQLAAMDRLGYEEAWIGGCRRASSRPTGRPSPGAPGAPAVPPTGRDYFLPLLGKIRGREIIKTDPAMADADVTLAYLVDHIWIVGSPATVAAKLRRLGEEVGGFGTLPVIAHEWRPREAWERSMRRLEERVLPRLAA
ncbi:MAG TPA: LLM class flavin-dependent oxidoreductase [Methylomirabilota bacterium]|nr:LLM class flavin-dependent oxidoreductase [Methylomirabilota bacterium]